MHFNILNYMVYSGNTIVCLDLRLHRVRTNVLNLLDFFFLFSSLEKTIFWKLSASQNSAKAH